MSESDEVISKEVFDKMKQRFRKEAMQAVEEAEARGYEKGKEEMAALYEEQAVMWKAIADVVKAQNAAKVNATPLLKFIMGQVYKDAKKEFAGDAEALEKLKAVLITSNDALSAKMPELLLSTSNHNSSSNNLTANTPFKTPTASRRPSATAAAPSVTFQSGASMVCHFRPYVFSCYFKPQAPKFFLNIKVPSIVDNVVKGMFRTNEFTTYKLDTEVVSLSSVLNNAGSASFTPAKGTKGGAAAASQSHILERRHSEFKAFYQQLVKAYPHIIIPWIKSSLKKDKLHNTPINTGKSSSSSGQKKDNHKDSKDNHNNKDDDDKDGVHSDEKLNNRKRQYKMWLQFLGNIEAIQCAPLFVQFISGYKSWEDALASQKNKTTNSNIRQSSNYIINANAAKLLAVSYANQADPLGLTPSSSQHRGAPPSTRGGASFANNSSSTGHNANALEAAMFNNDYSNASGGVDVLRTSYLRHKQAYQDLHTVYRDVLQLEPNATAAIESTQNLVAAYKNSTGSLIVFIADIDEWSRCEPSGSYELHALRVLSSACSFTLPNIYNITATLQEGMFDHFEFLHGSYLSTSKDALESVMKVFNSKLVDKVMQATVGSSGSTGGSNEPKRSKSDDRGSICDANAIVENNDNFRAAVSVSTSWEAARASRSSMLLQLMIDTATNLANEYKEITKQWEYAYGKLGGVERDPVLRTARENESKALSDVIKGELHAYEENVESIKENYEATHKMQDMFVKLSGALRNPAASNMDREEIAKMEASYRDLKGIQAIKERPVLPAGVRRDPSLKPVNNVTFSEAATPAKGRVRTKSEHDRASAANHNNSQPRPPPPERKPPPPAAQHNNQHSHEPEEDNSVFDRRRPGNKRTTANSGAAPAVASKIKQTAANSTNMDSNIFGSQAPQPGYCFPEGVAPVSRVRTKSEYEAFQAAQQGQHAPQQPQPQHQSSAQPEVTPVKARTRTTSEHIQANLPTIATTQLQPVNEDPLPEGWEQVTSEEGQVYYYHRVTRLSRWERPTEKVAAALNERLNKEKADIDEAVQKRKQEFQNQKAQQEEKVGMIEAMQGKVNNMIKKWRLNPSTKDMRDISELLNTVHLLVTFIPEGSVVSESLNPKSNPGDVKKAYMRAVRFVHPDKLAENIDVETAMLAEGVFITLTDCFNAYRTKIENALNAAANR